MTRRNRRPSERDLLRAYGVRKVWSADRESWHYENKQGERCDLFGAPLETATERRARARSELEAAEPRVCGGCGEAFQPVRWAQAYCSARCRQRGHRARRRESRFFQPPADS